jgi:hypothetical protein
MSQHRLSVLLIQRLRTENVTYNFLKNLFFLQFFLQLLIRSQKQRIHKNTNLTPLKQLWKLRIFVYMRLSIVKIDHILRENAEF